MRLEKKIAIVVGAGQTPGETIGNGRATSILFAREGAELLLVDRDERAASETLRLIEEQGGRGSVLLADVRHAEDCARVAEVCLERHGRIDILHNNVGIGTRDAPILQLEDDAWDLIFDVNLKSFYRCIKAALPTMQAQQSGCILNVSSVAAVAASPLIAYKTSKAGVNALTQSLAISQAKYGIRVNAIMPGLMNTPMAIEGISKGRGVEREKLIAQRDAAVPLRRKMGSAWDVAHAALFLASDEAGFITGVCLPVDGGMSARVG